ncbi:MAG: aminomethyl-transferring glycine dehydrogenase subunit GcvPB, partial [Sulfolobales archaeon]|nr:aminomethyl-transferring glycine dehydrogenase subunit GcvPB [Sulfolobales archaeon]
MKNFRQARWDEPVVYEVSRDRKEGTLVDSEFREYSAKFFGKLPEGVARKEPPPIPSLSEVEVVRHFMRLSQMSYGVDFGPVP